MARCTDTCYLFMVQCFGYIIVLVCYKQVNNEHSNTPSLLLVHGSWERIAKCLVYTASIQPPVLSHKFDLSPVVTMAAYNSTINLLLNVDLHSNTATG